ncbi:MAG: hypothetical protein ACOX7R_05910 [Acetivibrionales bacterium]|jgi:hypothetical protein
MRVKRLEKYRKIRYRKIRDIFIYAFILPSLSIFIGYVLTLLIILPSIEK